MYTVRVQLNNMYRRRLLQFLFDLRQNTCPSRFVIERVSESERASESKSENARAGKRAWEWVRLPLPLARPFVLHLAPANGVIQNHRMTVSKSKIKIIFCRVFVFSASFLYYFVCVPAARERETYSARDSDNTKQIVAVICTIRWMGMRMRRRRKSKSNKHAKQTNQLIVCGWI